MKLIAIYYILFLAIFFGIGIYNGEDVTKASFLIFAFCSAAFGALLIWLKRNWLPQKLRRKD